MGGWSAERRCAHEGRMRTDGSRCPPARKGRGATRRALLPPEEGTVAPQPPPSARDPLPSSHPRVYPSRSVPPVRWPPRRQLERHADSSERAHGLLPASGGAPGSRRFCCPRVVGTRRSVTVISIVDDQDDSHQWRLLPLAQTGAANADCT